MRKIAASSLLLFSTTPCKTPFVPIRNYYHVLYAVDSGWDSLLHTYYTCLRLFPSDNGTECRVEKLYVKTIFLLDLPPSYYTRGILLTHNDRTPLCISSKNHDSNFCSLNSLAYVALCEKKLDAY